MPDSIFYKQSDVFDFIWGQTMMTPDEKNIAHSRNATRTSPC